MTIIVSIPQQQYTPQTATFNPVVPVGVKQFKILLTRVAWPAGEVLSTEITYPNGHSAGVVGFSGGNTLARDGSATSAMWIQNQDGTDLPAGTYSVAATVKQTITTTITVERF